MWRFPEQFLSGIGYGYLKLDIVLVYMVSTFAVTASGAAVLAATEELLARTAAAGRPTDGLTLSDVLGYIWTRKLEVEGEGAMAARVAPRRVKSAGSKRKISPPLFYISTPLGRKIG